jgi:hypothetical protein
MSKLGFWCESDGESGERLKQGSTYIQIFQQSSLKNPPLWYGAVFISAFNADATEMTWTRLFMHNGQIRFHTYLATMWSVCYYSYCFTRRCYISTRLLHGVPGYHHQHNEYPTVHKFTRIHSKKYSAIWKTFFYYKSISWDTRLHILQDPSNSAQAINKGPSGIWPLRDYTPAGNIIASKVEPTLLRALFPLTGRNATVTPQVLSMH